MNEKNGRFGELFQSVSAETKAIAVTLKALIAEVHPNATEVVRLGDKAASYGWGEKKNSEAYVYIMPFTSRVNLGFYQGAHLKDPDGIVEGTGKNLRHVKVSSVSFDREALKALILEAKEERRAALGLPNSPEGRTTATKMTKSGKKTQNLSKSSAPSPSNKRRAAAEPKAPIAKKQKKK